MRPASIIAAALLSFALPDCAIAQVIQGQVVRQGTLQPRGGAHVSLRTDADSVVRETDADSTIAAFYLDAPGPGRYRLAVYDQLGNPYVSAPFQADSGAIIQRRLVVPALPPVFDSLPLAPLSWRPGTGGVRYPNGRRDATASGTARLAFVVDTTGHVEPETIVVIAASHPDFADATRAAISAARFVPFAPPNGASRRVVEQVTVAFNIDGAPVQKGDVITKMIGRVQMHAP